MNYEMIIEDQESKERFDVSSLVNNIQHSTSLYGQPGKLTFNLEKDPNDILKISLGSLVMFKNNKTPIFYGYVFKLGTDRTECYKVVAYDQMRYLQNHDYLLLDNLSLPELFTKICTILKLKKNAIKGNAKTLFLKINKKHFANSSYFDMLQYAMDESFYSGLEENPVDNLNSDLKIGSKVEYLGGESWKSPNQEAPETTNRTSGTAIVSLIDAGSKHPYHLIGETSNVYGWCDRDQFVFEETVKLNNNGLKRYFIRDNFGILELNDVENVVRSTKFEVSEEYTGDNVYRYIEDGKLEPLIIGDESLLTDYRYEVNIDNNTFNEIYVMKDVSSGESNKTEDGRMLVTSNGENLVVSKQDSESVSRYGLLRKIINIKNGSDKSKLEDYAKSFLEVYKNPEKTMVLEALGYDGITAGNGFLLRLNKLNINMMVYVLSATHFYNSDLHTMTLEVSTIRNMTEINE